MSPRLTRRWACGLTRANLCALCLVTADWDWSGRARFRIPCQRSEHLEQLEGGSLRAALLQLINTVCLLHSSSLVDLLTV